MCNSESVSANQEEALEEGTLHTHTENVNSSTRSQGDHHKFKTYLIRFFLRELLIMAAAVTGVTLRDGIRLVDVLFLLEASLPFTLYSGLVDYCKNRDEYISHDVAILAGEAFFLSCEVFATFVLKEILRQIPKVDINEVNLKDCALNTLLGCGMIFAIPILLFVSYRNSYGLFESLYDRLSVFSRLDEDAGDNQTNYYRMGT